jgi:putative ABC transport system permease protein
LNIGDTILLHTGDSNNVQTIPLVLRGSINTFPTVYPQDGDFFLMNLDYVLGITGQQPWTVLLRLAPNASPGMVRNELANLPENPIYQTNDSVSAIFTERSLPQSTGLFGSLTVGFLVAALLTVMGFLLYSYLSYQRRLQQLGIMRAIGLSVWGLVSMLGFEQLFLLVLGVALGTAIGRYASSLFIPFMHIDLDAHANVPPFLVHTPWDQILKLYLVLGVMLALALPVMITMLLRMKIHEATKLGEEQG